MLNEDISASINNFDLPYSLSPKTSSEYILLRKRLNRVELIFDAPPHRKQMLENITVKRDSLNSLIIFGSREEIDYLLFTTPHTGKKKRSALRFFRNPRIIYDKLVIKDENDHYSSDFSLLNNVISNYELLTEGFYEITLHLYDEECKFRFFLESGEFYTLTLLKEDDRQIPSLRAFVDNLPGDQYITPKLQITR